MLLQREVFVTGQRSHMAVLKDFALDTLIDDSRIMMSEDKNIISVVIYDEKGVMLWGDRIGPTKDGEIVLQLKRNEMVQLYGGKPTPVALPFHERVRKEYIVDGYNLPNLTDDEIQSFPVLPWPKNPVFTKPQYAMFRTRFVPAEQLWEPSEQNTGKFVAVGYCISPDGHIREMSTRTSLIVHVDIELGYFETLNSHYWMK